MAIWNPTRRQLLNGSLRATVAAAASALMPQNVQRMLGQTPTRRGSLRDIKHIVLLMQENRSFDHYFGTLAGVRGFDDPKALKLSTGFPNGEVSRRMLVSPPDGLAPRSAQTEALARLLAPHG